MTNMKSPSSPISLIEFLNHVLPAEGKKCWVSLRKKDDGSTDRRQNFCDTIDELVAGVRAADAEKRNAYTSCAVFDPVKIADAQARKKAGDKSSKLRSQENALGAQSLWLDIDAGTGKPYPDADAAIAALDAFCDKADIPYPTVVYSGNGVHCWWTFEEIIPANMWMRIAKGFKRLTEIHRLHADPTRTADISSILRGPDTYNWKNTDAPMGVSCEELMPRIKDLKAFCLKLSTAVPTLPPQLPPSAINIAADASNIYQNAEPSFAYRAVEQCGQMKYMRDIKGNIEEPLWYANLCVIAHCEDGEKAAQDWSCGHPSYSYEETKEKLSHARASSGPTTCQKFKSINPKGCDGCPHNVKSPIMLGHKIAAETTIEVLNTQYAWVERCNLIWRFKEKDFCKVADFKNILANKTVPILVDGSLTLKPASSGWLRSPERRQHRDVTYRPGAEIITKDNNINMWSGFACNPVKGNIQPFLELIELLFGCVTVIQWILQWLAYPIRYPGTKLNTAIILWSLIHGVGKSLLTELIAEIYGNNATTITDKELESNFNSWAKGRQFIVGEEIFQGDKRAIAGRIKHLVTGKTIQINEKFQPVLALDNTINFIFVSNSATPVHLEDHDRRYFVYEIKAPAKDVEFYAMVREWFDNGGKEALLHYLMYEVDLTGFKPKAPALMTEDKKQLIELGRSGLERYLHDLKANDLNSFPLQTAEQIMLSMRAGNFGDISITAIGRALAQLGAPKLQIQCSDGSRRWFYAVTNYEYWEQAGRDQWTIRIENQSKRPPIP